MGRARSARGPSVTEQAPTSYPAHTLHPDRPAGCRRKGVTNPTTEPVMLNVNPERGPVWEQRSRRPSAWHGWARCRTALAGTRRRLLIDNITVQVGERECLFAEPDRNQRRGAVHVVRRREVAVAVGHRRIGVAVVAGNGKNDAVLCIERVRRSRSGQNSKTGE